jgi:hypothetical protein
MKIRMKMTVTGTFHGNPAGVRTGDVVEVDDENGQRYIDLGYAEPLRSHPAEEHAVASKVKQERAVVEHAVEKPAPPKAAEKPVYGETHPPKDAPEPATKRGPGRPPKAK